MVGQDDCPTCGAPVHGMAICPACGAAVTLLETSSPNDTPQSASDAEGTTTYEGQSGTSVTQDYPPRLPRARVALLLLNVMLLLMAATLGGLDVFEPAAARGQPAPRLVLPTATTTVGTSDTPVFTVSAPTPHPTSTAAHQGPGTSHPPAPTGTPTATVPARPTATPVPTRTATPTPTPTPTPNNSGG